MVEISLRIAHISDTHISPHGQFLPKEFDRAISSINSLDPKADIVIHSGDLTDNGVLSEYELAVEKLKAIKPRILIAPGNHDERNFGNLLFQELIGPVDSELRLGGVAIYVADSPQPDRDEGRLGKRRQLLLEEKLIGLPGDVKKVIVFHHHLVSVPYSGREVYVLEDAGDILDMVLRHRVDLVLMGHRHARRALRIENSILVNAGTVSSIRTRARLGHSFNVLDMYSDGSVEVAEISVDDGGRRILGSYTPK